MLPSVEVGGGALLCSAGHSEGGFTGVVGAHWAAVSRGAGGCKAASPAPVLAAAAHRQASLVLPASSGEDALAPSRLTPPPRVIALAPFLCSIESPWRVRGAAARLLSRGSGGRWDTRAVRTVEGIPDHHPLSWAHCRARVSDGASRLPRAQTGGRTAALPRDCRRARRAGRRRAVRGGDRHHRRSFWTAPADSGMGGRVEAGKGRGPTRHAQEMQEPKIFHHCSRPPPPSGTARHGPPQPGGAGPAMRCGAFPLSPEARRGGGAPASAGAALEVTPERARGVLGCGRCSLPASPRSRRSATGSACGRERCSSRPRRASPRRFRSSEILTAQRAIWKGFGELTG